MLAARLTSRLEETGGEALIARPYGWITHRGLVRPAVMLGRAMRRRRPARYWCRLRQLRQRAALAAGLAGPDHVDRR
ncbi:hypothetical protein Shyd_18800 [Streptomyces hydrogenans]|uniref:Uncharacterized protein n=1 Tax=Streptomyces hydrogenans TaxID=1873719 RepID=A0ABQ3P664_9ACTN|nr:hypothetical protein Shyd_18800 [Streptomyces hydrogenans]